MEVNILSLQLNLFQQSLPLVHFSPVLLNRHRLRLIRQYPTPTNRSLGIALQARSELHLQAFRRNSRSDNLTINMNKKLTRLPHKSFPICTLLSQLLYQSYSLKQQYVENHRISLRSDRKSQQNKCR
jgi:hypothetical protein